MADACAELRYSNAMPNSPNSPESRPERIRSIEQLLRSRWAELAQNPELCRKLPSLLRGLLETLPTSHPVAGRIRTALHLFERESAGGLASSRNLIILSAALLYTFWPADAIPDLLPLVGWLDDAGLLTLVLATLSRRFRRSAPPEDSTTEPPENEPKA